MPVTKPTSPSHPHPSSKDGHRASSTAGGLTSSHPHSTSTIPSASVTSRTYSITSRGLASAGSGSGSGSGSGTVPAPHIISSITSRRPMITNDNNTSIPIGKAAKTMGNTNGTGGATGTTTGATTARGGDKNKNNFSKSGPVSSSKLGSSSVMSSTLDVDSDDDAISEQQREIEREAKRQLQAKLKKEQESGPPPDMNKRQLIFDSMSKIISRSFGKGSSRSAILGETRGTYVYTWGAGYHGQLGRRFERGKKKYATIPKMVPIDIAVRQVACGGLHTAAVTDAGTVYTWGDARAHQLGYQPHGFTNQPTPHLVESLEGHVFITQVACGQSHTVALSDKGNLISWGLSKFGQGGHNDRQVIKAPRKIRIDDPTIKFVDVSCGDKHTVALTSKGVVYSFGCAQQGQLGHDESPPVDKLKPTLVEGLRHVNVTSVVCGAIHTCVVTDQGAVYTFGFGEHFYPNEDQNFFYKPVRIPFADRVVQVACGQSHIIALNDRGDVYTWGSGSYGQLGHGVKGNLNVPRLVLTGKSIAQVAAGRYHSVALTSFGAMYAWGCGENGQLGHHTDDNVLFPKVIEPAIGTVVGQIACGEHHTAVLTSTPWLKVSDEIAEWLHSEREEYALKVKYLKKTNHGLVKKDLLKIQERMDELHTAWAQEKRDRQHDELEEQARDIQSVKQRETLMTEIAKQTQEQEQKQNYVVGPSDLSISPNEWKERDDDRPDSASHTINNGALIQDIRKRRTKGMGMSSILPRVNVNGAPATAPSSSQSTTDSRGPSRTGIMTARAASPEEHTETRALPALQLGSQTERRMVIPPPENRQAGVARSTFLKESSQMVRRMKQIIADTGDSSNESRLKKMITLVFGFRKDYDTLRSITTQKIKELEGIQRKVEALKKNNDSTKHRKKINAQTLKALKMKLSTVTIKITETEENRKNYALNIAHLKEEELERYYQLEALRKQCAENDAFARKINDIKLQSLEDKDRAEQELLAFQQEIHQFQGFIGDQLGKFHSISTLAKVRKEKREAEKLARTKKVHDRISQRINKLNEEMEEKNKEGLAMAQQLESVNERLRYFEKRFQQVASATGLTNPDEIINKFTLKEEIKHELNIEIQQKHNQIQQQTAKIAELQSELQYAKDNFVDSKWKDVDSLEEGVRDSDAKSEKNKSESERITQRLAYFREGLVSLISMLPDEILTNGTTEIDKPKVMADGNLEHTTDILALLDGKLDVLVHACEEGEMSRRQKEFEAAQEKREREAAAAARLAAEAAEKIKMTTLYNLTRRVSNDPHLMLSGPSSSTPHDVDVDGDVDASGPSSRDSSTHASRTDLLDGNKDELARTVQRDAVYNQAAAQRQDDGTPQQQQQVAAF